MKKIIPFIIVLIVLAGCKKELVKEPKRLIEKEKMVNIMYDLSILEATKIQNEASNSFSFVSFMEFKDISLLKAKSKKKFESKISSFLKILGKKSINTKNNKTEKLLFFVSVFLSVIKFIKAKELIEMKKYNIP